MQDFTQDLIICENAQEHAAKIARAMMHPQLDKMLADSEAGWFYVIVDTNGRSFYSEDLYTACDLFLKHNEYPHE